MCCVDVLSEYKAVSWLLDNNDSPGSMAGKGERCAQE